MILHHGRQRIRWPAVLALGIVTSHLVLHLASRNQLIHPSQKDFEACLALLVLVLGSGENQLIHGSCESYEVSDGTIIADFGELFRGSLSFNCFKKYTKIGKGKDNDSSTLRRQKN